MGWYVAGPLALKNAMCFSRIPGIFPVISETCSGYLYSVNALDLNRSERDGMKASGTLIPQSFVGVLSRIIDGFDTFLQVVVKATNIIRRKFLQWEQPPCSAVGRSSSRLDNHRFYLRLFCHVQQMPSGPKQRHVCLALDLVRSSVDRLHCLDVC